MQRQKRKGLQSKRRNAKRGDREIQHFHCYMTAAERALVHQAADKLGLSMSFYAGQALVFMSKNVLRSAGSPTVNPALFWPPPSES